MINGLIISPLATSREPDSGLEEALASILGSIDGVTGALLLGSRSRGNTHPGSNADVLLIVSQLEPSLAGMITAGKERAERALGVAVSVNVHTLADADPMLGRCGLFMHKNRAELFIYQAKYTSVLLSGKNIFDTFRDPMPTAVRAEAIRVTASFAYLLRKYLFDRSLAPHGAAEFVRTPLIFLEYLAAFHGYLSMGFQDGLAYLSGRGLLAGDDLALLDECADRKTSSRYAGIGTDLGIRACGFLERMMVSMTSIYRRHGVSDVRWHGSACELSWKLDLPQAAAMTVVCEDRGIVLLRRPDDDYLYPGQWTIPGGYLQPGEPPVNAAAREVSEETGLRVEPRPMMPGHPVISDRLAAFTFEAQISQESRSFHLAEHDARTTAEPDKALGMDLTPEARMVIERYASLHPQDAGNARTTQRES